MQFKPWNRLPPGNKRGRRVRPPGSAPGDSRSLYLYCRQLHSHRRRRRGVNLGMNELSYHVMTMQNVICSSRMVCIGLMENGERHDKVTDVIKVY